MRKAHPSVTALLGVTHNGKDKALAFATLAKEAVAGGASAKDWIAAVCAVCDGKGGGRDDSAQGTSADVTRVDAMLDAASAWAAARGW